jgi:hypothetical protein
MELTEKVLKELGLWEKAKQICIKNESQKGFDEMVKYKPKFTLSQMFLWENTNEGHDFWYNIEKTHNI